MDEAENVDSLIASDENSNQVEYESFEKIDDKNLDEVKIGDSAMAKNGNLDQIQDGYSAMVENKMSNEAKHED